MYNYNYYIYMINMHLHWPAMLTHLVLLSEV